MASGPEGTEAANYKTCVLKVSIHCEGCEKKIKRILHKVKGVYAIDIDAKQNRVTVSGNVDAESLIQKLVKYGKHAELLQEKNPTITTTNSSNAAAPTAKTEPKGNEKAAPAATATATAAVPETKEKKQAEKGKAVIESPETSPAAAASSDEVNTPKPGNDAQSQPEKNISEKATTADADGKKKEKEVKKEESKVDEREISDSVSVTGVNSPPAYPFPANFQPLYATVNYHTVHPSTSYAYYTAPPPEIPSTYTSYGNLPPPAYPSPAGYSPEYYYSPESYYGSMDQPSPSTGSYDMFNDENPNACKLM